MTRLMALLLALFLTACNPLPKLSPATPISVPSQAELEDRWRAPFGSALLLTSAYRALSETARQVHDGVIDRGEALQQVSRTAHMLEAAKDLLVEWPSGDDLSSLRSQMQTDIDQVLDITQQWIDQEGVPGNIEERLSAGAEKAESSMQATVKGMKADGLSVSRIRGMLDSFRDSLGNWLDEIRREIG